MKAVIESFSISESPYTLGGSEEYVFRCVGDDKHRTSASIKIYREMLSKEDSLVNEDLQNCEFEIELKITAIPKTKKVIVDL